MDACKVHQNGMVFRVSTVSIQAIEHRKWEAHLRLAFLADAPRDTGDVAGFSVRLLSELPKLCEHHCENSASRRFEIELRDTEVAHAFEHVCIELLAQAHPDQPRSSFVGRTGYDFNQDGDGVYRVIVAGFFSEEEVGRMVDAAHRLVEKSLVNV